MLALAPPGESAAYTKPFTGSVATPAINTPEGIGSGVVVHGGAASAAGSDVNERCGPVFGNIEIVSDEADGAVRAAPVAGDGNNADSLCAGISIRIGDLPDIGFSKIRHIKISVWT